MKRSAALENAECFFELFDGCMASGSQSFEDQCTAS